MKSKLLKRFFLVNIIIMLFLVLFLNSYVMKLFNKTQYTNMKNSSENVEIEINDELEKLYKDGNSIIKRLYGNDAILKDVNRFLDMSILDYNKIKMDLYSNSKDTMYFGIQEFVDSCFSSYTELTQFKLISFKTKRISSIDHEGKVSVELFNNNEKYYRKLNIDSKNQTITFNRYLYNQGNLKTKGIISLTFNLNRIRHIISRYNGKLECIIYDKDKQLVFSSFENTKIVSDNDIFKKHEIIKTKKNNYYALYNNKNSFFNIVTLFSKDSIEQEGYRIFLSIILVAAIIILISQFNVYISVKKNSDRNDELLQTMDKVSKGDLSQRVKIDNKKDDEINYVAQRFNEMCDNLETYIDQNYRLTLKQKEAEMQAMQAQIDPHFLYNTLESIRMKAICEGNKEVGNCLLMLSNLFRYKSKGSDVVTINEELNYVEQFIKIYQVRFESKFEYSIINEVKEDIKIPKFTLQPIVENYFKYGFKRENNDNYLKIKIIKVNNKISIYFDDNGNGISKERLNYLNDKLSKHEAIDKSIGLYNVNERLSLFFKSSKLSLIEKEQGICVLIEFEVDNYV